MGDGSFGMHGGGSGGGMMGMSERRAKRNIVSVTTLTSGIGLYLFDFCPELRDLACRCRQLEVTAYKVGRAMPEVVQKHPIGYKIVSKRLFGVKPPDAARYFADALL